MSTTVGTIISDALLSLKVVGEGQTITTSRYDLGVRMLNQLLSSWSKDFIVPNFVIEELTLPTSAQSYLIGSGSTLDTVRPESIISAQYVTGDSTYYPLDIVTDPEIYGEVPVKNTGGIPTFIYYNPTYPNGTIYFNFKPAIGSKLALTSSKAFTQATDSTTVWDGPLEYERLLRFGIAVELAPMFTVDPQTLQLIGALLEDALDPIRTASLSQRVPTLDLPVELTIENRYNGINDQ